MRKTTLALAIATMTLTGISRSVHAQTSTPPVPGSTTTAHNIAATTLPEVQVMGEREMANPSIVSINREDIQRHQASNMADVFANEPSVSIGGGARNAQRIYLRGVDSSNLNISIDGAQQGRNLHQHRGNIGGIDPDLLKQVDIQAGPTADTGPGALGGSIRMETVDAQDLLSPGQQTGATLRAGFASADEAKRGSSSVYGLTGKNIGLLAHIGASNQQNYRRGGGGDVSNSAGQDRDYFFKFSLLQTQGHSLRLSASRNSNTGLYLFGSTGSDAGYAPENAVPTRQRIERTTYTLEHRFRPTGNPLLDWRMSLYLNTNTLDDLDAQRGAQTHNRGGSLRNTARFAQGYIYNSLTVGIDFLDEEGRTDGVMGPVRLGGGRKTTQSRNLGVFVQDRLSYGPIQISAGLRYDDYDTDYGPYAMQGHKVSPNAGLEVALGTGFGAFASYGQAARGSGIIPMGFLTRVDEQTNFNDGNPLKAETSTQRQIGLNYQGHNLLHAKDRLHMRLSYFDTRIENLIEWVGGGQTYPAYIRNMTQTLRSKGWELRGGWAWGAFQTTLGFIHAKTTAGGEPVGVVRGKGASLGDRLSWDSRWQITPAITLGYTMNAVRRLSNVPKGNIERPGYTLHDVQLQWKPINVQGLQLELALRNLTDKRYTSQSSLSAGGDNILHEPGRDIRLSMHYRF